jgi:hypothetical protein
MHKLRMFANDRSGKRSRRNKYREIAGLKNKDTGGSVCMQRGTIMNDRSVNWYDFCF